MRLNEEHIESSDPIEEGGCTDDGDDERITVAAAEDDEEQNKVVVISALKKMFPDETTADFSSMGQKLRWVTHCIVPANQNR